METSTETRFQQIMARMQGLDYRMTPQRMALVEYIINNQDHPSAYQVYEHIRQKFPTMSQATVYKTLNLLQQLGEVIQISLKDDNHFDGYQPYPHSHVICTRCHKILDAGVDAPSAWMSQAEQHSGYKIDMYQLNLFGLCPDCQRSS